MPVQFAMEIKGIDKYLEALGQVFGDQMNEIVADMLNEVRPEIEQYLVVSLNETSETWTGATAETLFVSEVQQEGNYIFIELGADTTQDLAGLFKEFGTTRQAAEPFLRPTMRSHWLKNKLRGMMRAIFAKMQVDINKL